MRIFIVRHGEPDYERDCLTETGKQQAKEAALRLRNEGIQEIYSSPMGRALETAQETSDLLGIRPIRILPFMHELQWGSKDGTPVFSNGHPWDIADEMIRLNQDLTDPQWPESPMFRNNTVTESALLVMRETDRWLAGLGYVREGHYYRNVSEDDSQRVVALFCHGGSSSALLAHMLCMTFPYVCALVHLPFAGQLSLRLDRRPGSLCLPHLEGISG